MQVVILAGGKGARLNPFTTTIPKPLMPIDGTPILEIVLRQLKHYNFKDIIVAVNHMAELIMAFFGDGKKLGVNLVYSVEDKILGTAGPLKLINNLEDNFIVMNGDLLTTIDYSKLFQYHLENNNDVTIATYKKDIKIDLGVIKIQDSTFLDYIEKPTYCFDVSMGIYVFNKRVVDFINIDQKMDIPDLMLKLRSRNMKIQCYKGDYYWLDIGRAEDYEEANKMFIERSSEFLF